MVVLNKIKDTKTTPEGKNTNHLSVAQTEKCKECRKEFELKITKTQNYVKVVKWNIIKVNRLKERG